VFETGTYDKNTTVGYTKKQETRNIGDVWEDEHNRYEKKEGYILKTGKNSEALQEIRDFIKEKSTCKNSECKTIKKTAKDIKVIQQNGFCINCTIDREHELRANGLFQEYQNYKVWTRMIVYGKQKLEELKQSLLDVKEEYEYVNEDGTVEKWKLPKSTDEVKSDIQNMIDIGTIEIKELESKRNIAFDVLKEKNYEHYI
jgi:hypothetical protein